MAPPKTMQEFQQSSYLSGVNAEYTDYLYEIYLQNPNDVSPEWREYFSRLNSESKTPDVSHADLREQFRALARSGITAISVSGDNSKQAAVDSLIRAYRCFGHLGAHLDPLDLQKRSDPRLTLAFHGLSESDFNETFVTQGLLNEPQSSLKSIVDRLNVVYCQSVGYEFSAIIDEEERSWLRNAIEQELPNTSLSKDTQWRALEKLIEADTLEKYLDKRYVGQKRFSIEGCDGLIPLLDSLISNSADKNFHEVIIGMAHRGRINTLVNIMGKSASELFNEFEGKHDFHMTSGDVKYHLGYSSDIETSHGLLHLSLACNPSHLEFINPVVMGSTRSRQNRQIEGNRQDSALAITIHGDASFIGQGVVMETLSMSRTRAYCVGGTIHIIANNQVGFTTSNPEDARSSYYCSDTAKIIDAPVFHVNADDAEAVIKIAQLAFQYRMRFHKDIFIDLVGYRRHGHQEVDEPTATQPLMYQAIKRHPTSKEIYAKKLVAAGVVSEQQVTEWTETYREKLDHGARVADILDPSSLKNRMIEWAPYMNQNWRAPSDTRVSLETLKKIGQKLASYPEHFQLQRQVQMLAEARQKMAAGEQSLDWGFAEMLAYATLSLEGFAIRLSGEDCRRGTFFHRHSTVFNQKDGEEYVSLQHLDSQQARVEIYDSLLSETATLGFEYGYAGTDPKTLVIWEAQFGDFANGAQVIIDQFISSGWQKWQRLCGLVMLLPHGYEGAGPEHSSARLERYLQLCAQDNIQVCVPTTPAQIFHLLRRQMKRPLRIPLIVMTPKSLLRHKLAVSELRELSENQFQLIIPEVDSLPNDKVTRVVLCSGKVYYDLLTKRREMKKDSVAIIRIEQLYPFPYDELKASLAQYPNMKSMVWCQEEPKNQGGWFVTEHRLVECLPAHAQIEYAGRPASAAPAVGYAALHQQQQQELVDRALTEK